jgi:hypothetical protein
MILGMTAETYTLLHVLISLIAIGSGLVVLYGLLTKRSLERWTGLFLVMTIATSVTGFGFPFHNLTPAHIIGVISLLVLGIAVVARYALHLSGVWRGAYVIAALSALYLNVFVLVVQAFEKVSFLRSLAPTQKELPFAATQLALLALFVVLTILAVKRFRTVASLAGTGRVVA